MSYTKRFITSVLVAMAASLALTVCLALAHSHNAKPDAGNAMLSVAAKDMRAPVPATTPIIGATRLVFTSDRDGNTEIYSQAGDNAPQVNLTNNPATDACPVLSPDGTKIAFTSDRGGRSRIYVMDVDGGNVRAVAQFGDANSQARVYDPAWSPDGTKLVFVVNFNPNQLSTLGIVTADGSNDQRLLGVGWDAADPAWSPDGTRIAFIARGDLFNGERGEPFYLFVINTDNSRPSDPAHGVTRVASEPLAFNSLTYPPDGSGPTWSPDSTQLAFTSTRDGNPEIYTVSATGGAVQRLTNNPAADTLPTWFGQGIAFTSTRGGARDVYVMYPGGPLISGEPLMFRITGNAGNNFDADWGRITPAATPAASASRIAFIRSNSNDPDIYTANPDGTNEVNITNSPEQESAPAWSPDGKMIAYIRRPEKMLFVMNADGTNVRMLTPVSDVAIKPTWSPDGRRIAFIGGSDLAYTLSVVDVDGTNHRRIMPLDATYHEIAWSRDGTRLAYVLDRLSAFSDPAIHVVNLDGTGKRMLSTGNNRDRHPAWSPDGTKIAFTSTRDNGNAEIYLMNADGTNQTRLTNNAATDSSPTWSPDGQTIVFSSNRDGNFELYRMSAADGSGQARITNTSADELAPDWNQGARSTIQWRNASFRINERPSGIPGSNVDQLVVTRLGDLSHPATVEYATDDSCRDALGAPQAICTALASQRSDYVSATGTLRFAPGEDSKTIFIKTIDDTKVEGDERFNLVLSNPTGATLGEQRIVPVVITDNDTDANAPNPIDEPHFFVRMHYLDFLGREPEPTGLEAWVGVWTRCPNIFNDRNCDRVTISSSFFRSRESYVKGYFIYRFYRAALGRRPTYAEFVRDLPLLFAQTGAELEARQNDYNIAWMHRAEFAQVANTFPNEQLVDRLIQNIGITLTGAVTRETLIADVNAGRRTRAGVLRAVVEHPDVEHAEYNGAFVTMQYFGYLKRDPDADGFADWLNYLNANPTDFRTMVHGFVASNEYRARFGKP